MTGASTHEVAAAYPHSTLKGTPTCSSHSTVSHDAYIAGQEESECVVLDHYKGHQARHQRYTMFQVDYL